MTASRHLESITAKTNIGCLCLDCGECANEVTAQAFQVRRGITPTGETSICAVCHENDHRFSTPDGGQSRPSSVKRWKDLTVEERLALQVKNNAEAETHHRDQAELDRAELVASTQSRRMELWRARLSDQVAIDIGNWRTLPGLTHEATRLVDGFVNQASTILGGAQGKVPTLIIQGGPSSGRTTLAYGVVDALVRAGAIWATEAFIQREDQMTASVIDQNVWERGATLKGLTDGFINGRLKVAMFDDVGKGARLTDAQKAQGVMDQITDALTQSRRPLIVVTGLKLSSRSSGKPAPGTYLADYLDPSAYARIMRNAKTIQLKGTS